MRGANASGGHEVEGHLAAIGVTPEVRDVVDRLLFALDLRAEEAVSGRAVWILVFVAAFADSPVVGGATVGVSAAVVVVVVDAKREWIRPVVGVLKDVAGVAPLLRHLQAVETVPRVELHLIVAPGDADEVVGDLFDVACAPALARDNVISARDVR